MTQIRITFREDTPESYKGKAKKKLEKLGWVQNKRKVQIIPAKSDPNQMMRDITWFFDWPHDSAVVYPEDIAFTILSNPV